MARAEAEAVKAPRVFESQEARDNWQRISYGHIRNGFREPDEPPDDRRTILRDLEGIDEDIWQAAARRIMTLPDFRDLPFEQCLGLIVAAAGHELGHAVRRRRTPVRSMPMVKPMGEAAYNERMAKLRAQALGIEPSPSPVEDRRLPRERDAGEEG